MANFNEIKITINYKFLFWFIIALNLAFIFYFTYWYLNPIDQTLTVVDKVAIKEVPESLVQDVAYSVYAKLMQWGKVFITILLVLGVISSVMIGFEIWNVKKHIEREINTIESERKTLSDKVISLAGVFEKKERKYNELMSKLKKRISLMKEESENIKKVREIALQDIEDIKRYLPMINAAKYTAEDTSEGFVKYGDIDDSGNVVNCLWTLSDSDVDNDIPQVNSTIISNTCVFLRCTLPEISPSGEVHLGNPKFIISNETAVKVLHNYSFKSDSCMKIWLLVRLGE